MRLIDADSLQKKLTKKKAPECGQRYTDGFNDALLRFKSMIHSAHTIEPDADTISRPDGYWMRMSDLNELEDDRYKCSCCGNVVHHRDKVSLYTYNSWCGACGANNNAKNYAAYIQ